MSVLPGTRFERYEILSLLGRGGMGEVYLALDTRLGRRIALKLLPVEYTRADERVRRFEQEARAASALNHPNIITIHEVGSADGTHFMATELVEGQTLRDALSDRALGVEESVTIAIQIASALDVAHKAGIVHRDVKPENIMIRPDGVVKLLDFGLVKLIEGHGTDSHARTIADEHTGPGVVMGTARYMSPEQSRGLDLDSRTDIFSLGAVLYEMIARRSAFDGATASDLIAAILRTDPAPLTGVQPAVPPELEHIVRKSLRKDREDRYQSVRDLLIDLRDFKRGVDFEAASGPVPSVAGPRTRRPLAAFALAVVAVLMAGALVAWYVASRVRRDTPAEQRDAQRRSAHIGSRT